MYSLKVSSDTLTTITPNKGINYLKEINSSQLVNSDNRGTHRHRISSVNDNETVWNVVCFFLQNAICYYVCLIKDGIVFYVRIMDKCQFLLPYIYSSSNMDIQKRTTILTDNGSQKSIKSYLPQHLYQFNLVYHG